MDKIGGILACFGLVYLLGLFPAPLVWEAATLIVAGSLGALLTTFLPEWLALVFAFATVVFVRVRLGSTLSSEQKNRVGKVAIVIVLGALILMAP